MLEDKGIATGFLVGLAAHGVLDSKSLARDRDCFVHVDRRIDFLKERDLGAGDEVAVTLDASKYPHSITIPRRSDDCHPIVKQFEQPIGLTLPPGYID
jgi:hypothetical protein